MSSLVDTIQGLLTPQLIGTLSANTGVSETRVRDGLSASMTSITDGLTARARDPLVMRDAALLINEPPEIDTPMSLLDENSAIRSSGARLLGLASNDVSGMIHRIGGSLNLGTGIVSTLLVAAAGLVTSALRKVSRASGGLDARGLSALLMDRGVARAPSTYVRARPVYESRPVERTARRQGGLLWLLALVPLAILAIWFFARPHEIKERVLTNPTAQVEPTPAPVPSPVPDKHDPASITTTEPAPAPVTATTEPTPAPADTTTPAAPAAETTASLDLPSGSPEAMLMSQAETPASSNDWIDLDAVKFPTDSAEVPAEAKGQIEHVAEIMKAKPDLTIAIAGHTSTTGTKEHNMQLSEERAEAVRKVLVDDGIDQSRVQTSGLADENKAVDTTNEEAANRRISARVVNAVPEG